ncbi:ROK family protein [Streptomyces sp. NPDC050392]|uniref:ROK family protein n=1 Tax=Streptomyces sp. NPDC050392 TaxID=3155782 RepID=UPI00341A3DC8
MVDAAGRVRASTPLPDWKDLDLAREAGRWFGCPAYVENDANLAAVAELWRGADRDAGDFIQLLTGKRTGAARTTLRRPSTWRLPASSPMGSPRAVRTGQVRPPARGARAQCPG